MLFERVTDSVHAIFSPYSYCLERRKRGADTCKKLYPLLAQSVKRITKLDFKKYKGDISTVYPIQNMGRSGTTYDVSEDPRVHVATLQMLNEVCDAIQITLKNNMQYEFPLVSFREPLYYDFAYKLILNAVIRNSRLCELCGSDEAGLEEQLKAYTRVRNNIPHVKNLLTLSKSNFDLPVYNSVNSFLCDPRKIGMQDLLRMLCPVLCEFPDPYSPLNADERVMAAFAQINPEVHVKSSRDSIWYKIPTEVPRVYILYRYSRRKHFVEDIKLVIEHISTPLELALQGATSVTSAIQELGRA